MLHPFEKESIKYNHNNTVLSYNYYNLSQFIMKIDY